MPSYPGAQGAQDSANIPAGTNANINCTVSVLGGLAQGSSSVTITLQNTLTIDGGQSSASGTSQFNWSGGNLIPAAAGDNLVLNDINPSAGGDHDSSNWSGGTFGDDVHQMSLILLNASQLTVNSPTSAPATMKGSIQVGEASGPTTACNMSVTDGAELDMGTATAVAHVITVETSSEWDYLGAGTLGGGNLDDGDQFKVDGATKKYENNGTTQKGVKESLPMVVTKAGTVVIQSNLVVQVSGSTAAALPYAVDIGKDNTACKLQLGFKNPGDTGDGNSRLDTLGNLGAGFAGSGNVHVGSKATLEVDGLSNGMIMGGSSDWTLFVDGTLLLGNTNNNTSFEKSTLTVIGANNKNSVNFGSTSTFSFAVLFGATPDNDTLTVSKGNVTIIPGATYAVQKFGTPAAHTFTGVIKVTTIGMTVSGSFTDIAGWKAKSNAQSVDFQFTG